MEHLIDAFTGFLIVSSALLLALGVLSCLVLNVFNIRGKARLLICSLLMILPVIYPIGSLIPDHHKVRLPAKKLQTILPAALEPGINTFTYDMGRSAGADLSPAAIAKPASLPSSSTQTSSAGLHGTRSVDFTWKQVIIAAWAFLSVFLLMRSLFFFSKIRRLIKYADCVTDPAVLKILQQCQNETGLHRTPRLLVVNHTLTPMAAGFFQPAVILPARLLIPAFREGLRFTLLHELKHLQRRDNWWLLVESLVGAIYFFHPVIYWAKRKIHEEWEHICDRHVVQVTNKSASYADFLLHEIWSHGREINPSLATPLIFKTRRTAKRVQAILLKMTPTLFSKIRDRIAISTVFVCFTSVFLCTVTPSANVNEVRIKVSQPEWDQFMVNETVPSLTKDTENLEPDSVNNDSIAEIKELKALEFDETSGAGTDMAPSHPEPVPASKAVNLIREKKAHDAKIESPDDAKEENDLKISPTNEEKLSLGTENLPSVLTERTGIIENNPHLFGSETLSKTSDLLASIGPDSLSATPQTPQEVSVSADEKNAERHRDAGKEADNPSQDRSATSMKSESSSGNVSIPIGARIFDWKMIDRRNIIIETYFYGSFKATLAEDRPKISSEDIAGVEAPWPYAVTETSTILLSNGNECRIQKLVPYAEKRGNVYDVF